MTGLARFLLRRLLGIAFWVWAVTLVTFALFRVGVPNPGIDAEFSQQLGPGRPVDWQYVRYLQRLPHGNLGQALTEPASVNTILREGLPPTISLLVGGMVLWLTAGVLIGAVSALRPGSWPDRLLTTGVMAVLNVPTFLLALLLLAVLVHLAAAGDLWLQPGYVPFSHSPGQWLGRMILPWIAVVAGQAGVTTRLTRSGILEVLDEDYVRAVRAKGLTQRRVLWFHVLRAGSLPVVSSIGAGFGITLGACFALLDPRVRIS